MVKLHVVHPVSQKVKHRPTKTKTTQSNLHSIAFAYYSEVEVQKSIDVASNRNDAFVCFVYCVYIRQLHLDSMLKQTSVPLS